MNIVKPSNKLFFSTSELCITSKDIPQDVADKLLKYHIHPMNVLREQLGDPIWASQSSGYRPQWYEKQRGRSGKSQHCFEGKGAVDWTASSVTDLLELLVEKSDYARICYYANNGFIHCDYKNEEKGRFLYICDSPISHWKKDKKL